LGTCCTHLRQATDVCHGVGSGPGGFVLCAPGASTPVSNRPQGLSQLSTNQPLTSLLPTTRLLYCVPQGIKLTTASEPPMPSVTFAPQIDLNTFSLCLRADCIWALCASRLTAFLCASGLTAFLCASGLTAILCASGLTALLCASGLTAFLCASGPTAFGCLFVLQRPGNGPSTQECCAHGNWVSGLSIQWVCLALGVPCFSPSC